MKDGLFFLPSKRRMKKWLKNIYPKKLKAYFRKMRDSHNNDKRVQVRPAMDGHKHSNIYDS
jgi:hypothetical protein